MKMKDGIIDEPTNPIVSFIKSHIIVIAAICVGIILFFCVFVFDPFNLHLTLRSSKRTIEKTSNVISEIKKISEFTSACYYEEIVLDQYKYKYSDRKVYNKNASTWSKVKSMTGFDGNQEYTIVRDSTKNGRIVFVVKSRVRAGYDLSKIKDGDLIITNDTLSVKLPDIQIFDIIVNPSDWEVYHQEGKWNDSEIKAVQSGAKDRIKNDAIEFGLLEKAESFGKESLVSLFKSFGFAKVVLQE